MEDEEHHLQEIVDFIFEEQLEHILSEYLRWSSAIMQYGKQKKHLDLIQEGSQTKDIFLLVISVLF